MDSNIPNNYISNREVTKQKFPLLSNTYKVINSSFICFNNYVIGSGSFGKVLYSLNIDQTEEYAIKFEKPSIKNSVLEEELTIYKNLFTERTEGLPRIYWYGEYKKYKIMVMDLLGPSLDKFYKICNKQFTVDTTINLGYQMINRIEHVHKMGYIHRDIKPNNFLLGKFNRDCSDNLVYIIDFGLSKDYICPETGKHYEFSDNKRFVGTPRYASLNTHLGYKQSRRDDLESIIYVLIYFLKGELPWQGVKAKTKSEKKEKIKKKKKSMSIDKLCEGIPYEFVEILTHIKTLEFKQQPDYDLYRQMLKKIYEKHFQYSEFIWDWEALFIKTQEYPQLLNSNKSKYEKLYEGYPIDDFNIYLSSLMKRYQRINIKNLNNDFLKKIISSNCSTGVSNDGNESSNGEKNGKNGYTNGKELILDKMNSAAINFKNQENEYIGLEKKNSDNNKAMNNYFKTNGFNVDFQEEDYKEKKITKKKKE